MDGVASLLDRYVEFVLFGAVVLFPASRIWELRRVRAVQDMESFLGLEGPRLTWTKLGIVLALCFSAGLFGRAWSHAIMHSTHMTVIGEVEALKDAVSPKSARDVQASVTPRHMCDYLLPAVGVFQNFGWFTEFGTLGGKFCDRHVLNETFATYLTHTSGNVWFLRDHDSYESMLGPLSKSITVASAVLLASGFTVIVIPFASLKAGASRAKMILWALLLYVLAFETYWSLEHRFHLLLLVSEHHLSSEMFNGRSCEDSLKSILKQR